MPYLSENEDIFALARTCRCTYDDFVPFVDFVVDEFMPYLKCFKEVDEVFKRPLFVKVFGFLKKNYPQLTTEPTSFRDLVQLCESHAEILKPIEVIFNYTRVATSCPKLKKASEVMFSLCNFKALSNFTIRSSAFEEGLFYTCDYLLWVKEADEEDYYTHSIRNISCPNHRMFLKRVTQFKNPARFLKMDFDFEFAVF